MTLEHKATKWPQASPILSSNKSQSISLPSQAFFQSLTLLFSYLFLSQTLK